MNMRLKEVNENIISLLKDLRERTENDEIEWIFNKDSGEVNNYNEDRAIFVTKKAYVYDNNIYVLHLTRRFINNDFIVRTDTKYNSDKTYDELKVVVWDTDNKTDYYHYNSNVCSTIINRYTVNGYMGDDIKIRIKEQLDSLYEAVYKKLSFDNNYAINKYLADAMYAIINGEVIADDRN